MRQDGLLRTQSDESTQHVLMDAEVALGLAKLVENHYNWDECLGVLNLILETLPDSSKDQAARRSSRRVSTLPVNANVIRTVLNAILSPRFIGLPGRRLAGQTATQVFADYSVFRNDPAYLALNIRICGFASNIFSLRRLVKRINAVSLSKREQFELALAHARCLQPDECRDMLATISDLTKEQQIEARMALCAAYAEVFAHDNAWEQLRELEDESLWTADQTAFDKHAVVYNSQINIVYATALALTPRRPFTYNYHTVASAHCSPRFSDQNQPNVSQLLETLSTSIQENVGQEQRRRFSLRGNLFRCECAVYAMCAANSRHTTLTLAGLGTQLHRLQQELVHRMTTDPADAIASGLDYASSLLRSYLWALVFTVRTDAVEKNRIAWGEIKHAEVYIPGFEVDVAVLEPALVLRIPRSAWNREMFGTFKGNSSFMMSDEAMCLSHWQPTGPMDSRVAQLAADVAFSNNCDHRMYPLRVLLAVSQGCNQQARKIAEESIAAPQTRIVPGTLALENCRTSKFFEQLVLVLSMFKQGSDLAIAQIRALMQSQFRNITMTERMAAAFLYCCIRSRNETVAHDIMLTLERHEIAVTPRIQELYMRACLRAGLMARALAVFHRLSYEGGRNVVGEPSFVYFINYMADQRESHVGAEHAFDTWLKISDYRGHATPRLVQWWKQQGMSRGALNAPNAFLPKTQLSEVLQAAGIKQAESGQFSNKQFLRNWEFHVVISLVSAYVTSGQLSRALVWEEWILNAIHNKQLRMKPELVTRVSRLLKRHLEHDSWDQVEFVLRFIVAIDRSIGMGNLGKQVYFLSLQNTFSALAHYIQRNDPVKTRAQIRAYLKEHDALYVSKLIEQK
ncbi:hypothetical protein GGF43_004413 [Coemansia sp. RSA 2618]|nr:hypothetical protein GGF43_004413 [Coemansia sp. RSA 2618]